MSSLAAGASVSFPVSTPQSGEDQKEHMEIMSQVKISVDLLSMTTASRGLSLASVLAISIFRITPFPETTSPKTTCFPSKCGVSTVVTKNWEPFVPGPAFAMDKRKGLSCFLTKFSSSKRSPYIDSPPEPSYALASGSYRIVEMKNQPYIAISEVAPLNHKPLDDSVESRP